MYALSKVQRFGTNKLIALGALTIVCLIGLSAWGSSSGSVRRRMPTDATVSKILNRFFRTDSWDSTEIPERFLDSCDESDLEIKRSKCDISDALLNINETRKMSDRLRIADNKFNMLSKENQEKFLKENPSFKNMKEQRETIHETWMSCLPSLKKGVDHADYDADKIANAKSEFEKLDNNITTIEEILWPRH